MRQRVRRERSAQSISRILEGAAKLFKEKGYAGVTVDDIARYLGISKLSIYYHIESKDEIFYQIHYLINKALIDGLEIILKSDDSPVNKLRQAVANYVNLVCSEMSPSVEILWQLHRMPAAKRRKIIGLRDRCDKLLRQIVHDGIASGDFTPCDVDVVVFAMEGAINHMSHWYSRSGRLSKAQLARIYADFFVRGLAASGSQDGPKDPTIAGADPPMLVNSRHEHLVSD